MSVLRKGVQEAGEELAGFLDPAKKPRHSASAAEEKPANFVGPSKPRYSDPKPRIPLVILTFDEAHELANPASTKEWNKWSLFSELRRVLRELRKSPIFSLFLSTASKFEAFNPDIHSDPSLRVTDKALVPLPPITEIGFDDLAYTAKEGTTTIEEVTHDRWMSHLGRPMYAFQSVYRTVGLTYCLEQLRSPL
jgi:hypothetical protein